MSTSGDFARIPSRKTSALAWPFDVENAQEVASTFAQGLPAGEYPNLLAMAEMAAAAPHGVPADFEFGLDLILDGLERLGDTARH